MTLDGSRIAKEITMVGGFFCRRKEADVALFLQVTRMRKIIKICKANLTSPKQDDHNGNER